MNEIKSSRFKDAPWYISESVVVGGAGGIGTWLSLLLTRAGFDPVVYDFDTVEEHNMGGQLFCDEDIGKTKVESLGNLIKKYTGTSIVSFTKKFDESGMAHDYMFSAFDNMKARKDMFNVWKKFAIKRTSEDPSVKPIFIDGRLSAENMQIFCVTMDNMEEYEKHLFDDSEVLDAPCTMKQTSHSAAMIASHMTAFFTNHITNVVEKDTVRNIPFLWEYYIPINYLKEE